MLFSEKKTRRPSAYTVNSPTILRTLNVTIKANISKERIALVNTTSNKIAGYSIGNRMSQITLNAAKVVNIIKQLRHV